jgi:hypothetical protein
MIQNVQLHPQIVFIGSDIAQVQNINCVADIASSLNNKYFLFHDVGGGKRYAWFNTGAGVDPAPAGGWIGHEVTIAAGASASAVATALQLVLAAVAGFDATVSGFVVTLTNTAVGYAQPAIDSALATKTNFAFKVTTLGQFEKKYDCLKGDIELSGFDQQKLEITCHAEGSTVQDERITGYDKPILNLIFQETDKQSIQDLMVMYGMPVFTPVGLDKEAIYGYGPVNVGGSNPKVRIRMHEAADDLSNKTNDYVFWTAQLGLDTFNFSGENISEIPATFTIFPDKSKPKAIQFYMRGDAVKAGY